MQKFLFSLYLLFMTTSLFALPCPNGSGILYKGDLLSDVIQQCGQPNHISKSTMMVPTVEKWTYYKVWNSESKKLQIIFNNNQIVNISVTMQNGMQQMVTNTAICGLSINQGDAKQKVQSICGLPTTSRVLEQKSIQMTRLRYGTTKPQNLVFENDKLIDFQG